MIIEDIRDKNKYFIKNIFRYYYSGNTLRKGDTFGDRGIVERKKLRSACAICGETTTLGFISQDLFI